MGPIPQQLVLQPEAGEAPDALVRIPPPDLLQKRQQVPLVLRLKGLAPQHRQPVDIGLVQLGENLRPGVIGEGLSIVKVPGLGLEAVRAVVGAAGHEQGHPDPDAVGNITFFQIAIVHDIAPFR